MKNQKKDDLFRQILVKELHLFESRYLWKCLASVNRNFYFLLLNFNGMLKLFEALT